LKKRALKRILRRGKRLLGFWVGFSHAIDRQKLLVRGRNGRVGNLTSIPVNYDDIDFVVVTKNSGRTLQATIDNVRTLYPESCIIIIDGGSRDDTIKIARESGCRVLTGSWNVGAARDLSLRVTEKRFLAHLDSDVQLCSGWLQLVKPYFESPDVAAVSGITLYGVQSDEALLSYCLESGLIGVAAFTNTLLDREKILKVGGIGHVQWGEDWEVYCKVIRNGYRWNLACDAYAYHRRYFIQQFRAYYNWSKWWRRTRVTSLHMMCGELAKSPFVGLLLGVKLHWKLTFYHPLLRLAALIGWMEG